MSVLDLLTQMVGGDTQQPTQVGGYQAGSSEQSTTPQLNKLQQAQQEYPRLQGLDMLSQNQHLRMILGN